MKLRATCFSFLKYLNDKITNDTIHDNQYRTVREMEKCLEISQSSVHRLLSIKEKLVMQRIYPRCLP